MYKRQRQQTGRITVNNSYQGENIEKKVKRITNNKEPISDGAPLIYTDRKDGVGAQYDIRTDRFEIAVEAMDKVTKSNRAKRDQKMGEKAKEGMEKEAKTEQKSGETTSVQGTGEQ